MPDDRIQDLGQGLYYFHGSQNLGIRLVKFKEQNPELMVTAIVPDIDTDETVFYTDVKGYIVNTETCPTN